MDRLLFVVTNRKLIKNKGLAEVVRSAVNGGADAIILREKDLSYSELYKLALELKKTINNKIPLIINGNLKAAESTNVKGIHFSYDKFMTINNIKQKIKGVSIHSLEEGIKAQKKEIDYVLAGHIFETRCKKGLKGRGIGYLKNLSDNLNVPVIAIGGIKLSNVESVLNAGAAGIAIMSSVMEADDPEKIVYKLKQKILSL